jgi:hypothetical protein
MAATFEYNEDNGPATGTPAKGSTRTTAVTQVNWKAVDDVATAYGVAPVAAGDYSMPKYQFAKFTGTFNQISNGLWAHVSGALPSGVTLRGKVSSTYATPAQTAVAGMTDISATTVITSGMAVLFSTVGPEGASPSATLAAAGYSQYLVTQCQTSGASPTGDSAPQTLRLRYSEN